MGGILGRLWNIVSGSRYTPSIEANPSPGLTGETNPLEPMAGTFENPEASLTCGINQISEAVYELYSPSKCEAELIFFHGLSVGESEGDYEEAYFKSWLSTDGKVIWPKEWLKLQVPTAKVLSVSYESGATLQNGDPGNFDMYNYGENLVEDIIHQARCGQVSGRPVILVGHCLGGIMIKNFISSAFRMRSSATQQNYERINAFLNNFKGVFFYSVPNGGSKEIESFAATLRNPSRLLANLRVLSTHTQRINEEFRALRNNPIQNMNVRVFAINENIKTNSAEFHGLVVVEASARQDVDYFVTHTKADHFTVCKARNAEDFRVINKLVQLTKDTISEAKGPKMISEAEMRRRAALAAEKRWETQPGDRANNEVIVCNPPVERKAISRRG